MNNTGQVEQEKQEGWYKYGMMFIFLEAFIALAQTVFALFSTLSGAAG